MRQGDRELERVRAALARREAAVDRMTDAWARARMPCCPSCAFGREYSDAADKAERTRGWLVVLLVRRDPADPEVARLLGDGVPAHVALYARRRGVGDSVRLT